MGTHNEWKNVTASNQNEDKTVKSCWMYEFNDTDAVFITEYKSGRWEVDTFKDRADKEYRETHTVNPASIEEAKAIAIALYRMA